MVIQSQDSSSTAKDTENAESRRPGVNFINLLPSALKCQDSKSAKSSQGVSLFGLSDLRA